MIIYYFVNSAPYFLSIPLTPTTYWRAAMASSGTGSADSALPSPLSLLFVCGCPLWSLLSISLIYGCMPSMAFIFLATSTNLSPSLNLVNIFVVRGFWMFLMAAVMAESAARPPLSRRLSLRSLLPRASSPASQTTCLLGQLLAPAWHHLGVALC